MPPGKICPFISTGNFVLLCNEGELEMTSNMKDALREQARGQIIDFDLLVPKESCMAWSTSNCRCMRLHQ